MTRPAGPRGARMPPGDLRRRLWRVGGLGLAATLLVLGVGRGVERLRLGPSDQTALEHVTAGARREFGNVTRALEATARQLAATPDLADGIASDVARRRALFDRTARLLAASSPTLDALSVYDASGRPLAWSGRPTPLPPDRLSGAAALFVAPGAPGRSLVHVEPVVAGRPDARRIGTVVAEAIVTREATPEDAGTHIFGSALVPLALRAPRFEGGDGESASAFALAAPDGPPLLVAEVPPGALATLRATYRERTGGAAMVVLALTLLLAAIVVRDAQERETATGRFVRWLLALVTLLVAARAALAWAVPYGWRWQPPIEGLGHGWLHSAADWLATSLFALALVALGFDLVQRVRLARRGVAKPADRGPVVFWLLQLAAGAAVGGILVIHGRLLDGVVRASGTHGLTFGLYPVEPYRLALVVGLLCANAAVVWLAAATLRLAATWWRVPRGAYLRRATMAVVYVGTALAAASALGAAPLTPRALGLLPPLALVVAATAAARWIGPRYRHASQAARLTVTYLALALPTMAFYPAVVTTEQAALEHTIATEYATEVLGHRDDLRKRLERSRAQLDAEPTLHDQFDPESRAPGDPLDADRAYLLWSRTELGRQRLTSSVELFDADGGLISRFALNLPAEFLAAERPVGADCSWDVFGEALASTDDQVLLHAGRAVCRPDGTKAGAILVHVVLDYSTLPFVAAQDPAAALTRGSAARDRATHGRSLAFAVYGWGRTPVYPTAGTAWPISTELLREIYRADRRPFWQVLSRGDQRHRVLLNNDRAGIYAIGYAQPRPIDHAVTLAEIATLASFTFIVLVVLAGALSRMAGRHPVTGRALLREVRRSFYRKLFLLFVAASVVPVLVLAVVTRNYVAGQLREGLESGAVRTASAARRVIETVVSQQRRDRNDPVVSVTDEIMVSVSRIIDQDVNVFVRDTLIATSQRDLFASGLLPTRIPAEVARAIGLERQSSYVGDERLGRLEYTVAAVPVRDGEAGAILTVPLTLRQQEIESEIASLDRRVTLAAVLFILLGAAIGYVTAERLGDPIQRLTRATRRIARGDLGARILTAPADELGRLVEAFNLMAEDLQRQRAELERTNRLAAWADMARQVAHDIKNPLTPIQLQAEFLRRVHADSGAPLGPVLDSCVSTILSQVSLLRSIASEFSAFASSPVARLAPTRVEDVVREVLGPYETGLPDTVRLEVTHEPSVPELPLDRGLLARALVNVIENALHAMRGGGTLAVRTRPYDGGAQIVVSDTGPGMDEQALQRLFEPYFSTKGTGTGLGLTIAKRNVELNGGTIALASEKGHGTTVTISLPAPARSGDAGGPPPSR